MKTFSSALLFATLCPLCVAQSPQTSPAPSQAQAGPVAVASAPAQHEAGPKPSAAIQPAIDALGASIGALNLDKWKKGSVREEAASNLSSIQHDLQSTLPPLLTQADSSPQVVSKSLPVSRNLDALYDVVLRVVDGARVAAPSDQFSNLQSAMNGLEKARHAFNDRMQETSVAQEKQIGDLQVALKTRPALVCPAPPPPCPPEPVKKKVTPKRKPKPATKTTPPATPQATPPAKPNS